MEETEARCESVFDGQRCVKKFRHRGKHMNNDAFQFVQWTKGGIVEWLKEQKQAKTEAVEVPAISN